MTWVGGVCILVVLLAILHAPGDVGAPWYHHTVPPDPTTNDLGVLWVWWVYAGAEVNMTVMHL